jgi:hypothetical protein
MSGSKRLAILALPVLVSAVVLSAVLLSMAPGARAGDKKPAPYAIVGGTVFRDPGFALPDAKVVLMLRTEPKPKKLQEMTSNYRGEFLFRVPPKEATYVLRASMKGYRPDEKEAMISGEEHIDVNLVLTPESK